MRQKVKTFLHIFKESLFPQPDYYSRIPKASFWFSFKYFATLIFIVNLVVIVVLVTKFNPGRANRFLDSVIKNLNTFPDELVINTRKGNLFTSFNRPYLFWGDLDKQRKLLMVIDETANPSKINQYRSIVLITSKEIVIRNDKPTGDKFSTLPLSYLGNQTFNKKISQKTIQALILFKKMLMFSYFIIVPGLIIFLPVSSFIITLFYLSLISLIVFIIFKVYFHRRIQYKKTLQIAFHAVTLPLLLDYFLIIFKPSIPINVRLKPLLPSPVAFVILLVVFVFAAVYETYQNGKHHPNHQSHPKKTRSK